MKIYLTLFIILCSYGVFAQVVETAAGKIDLQKARHNEDILRNDNNPDDEIRVIWYPDYKLYRECGNFNVLRPKPDGYSFENEPCNCAEHSPISPIRLMTARRIMPTAEAYANIRFEFDSSVIKTSGYPLLDAASADLRSSGVVVELDGYASSEGTAAHNLRLSRDRANSVKTYLVNSGVSPEKIKIKAYGETHPIADNSTEEGRVANRRVELHKK
jgi:outer membrane protein OmpA-like peptidoglycan-associated protein